MCLSLLFFFFERVSLCCLDCLGIHCVTQADLKLIVILLSQLPECWDYGCERLHVTHFNFLS